MGLPNYPRPAFGPSRLGLRFGLAQRGLDIALGTPLLWTWRVGLRAHFSNPITNYRGELQEGDDVIENEDDHSFKNNVNT